MNHDALTAPPEEAKLVEGEQYQTSARARGDRYTQPLLDAPREALWCG
ncbi:MAG: hypothetical protein ACAF41_32970 [Leptolyngbya sp. BL-A-14]